jgi:hypothetical protein
MDSPTPVMGRAVSVVLVFALLGAPTLRAQSTDIRAPHCIVATVGTGNQIKPHSHIVNGSAAVVHLSLFSGAGRCCAVDAR